MMHHLTKFNIAVVVILVLSNAAQIIGPSWALEYGYGGYGVLSIRLDAAHRPWQDLLEQKGARGRTSIIQVGVVRCCLGKFEKPEIGPKNGRCLFSV